MDRRLPGHMDCGQRDLRAASLLTYGSARCVCSLLLERVPDAELSEMRRILGDALLDQCSEMHSEVELWLHIWRGACCRPASGRGNPHAPLADPPRIKALLREEIRLLLLAVRCKADEEGGDGVAAVSRYNCDVVRYAMASEEHVQLEAPSRPQSAQHQQVVRCHTDWEAITEKLTIRNIDEVVDHVKSALKEECELLAMDVQFLQACVEQEHNEPELEPTLAELRSVRSIIEEDLKGASVSPRPMGWTCHPQPCLGTPQHSDDRGGRSTTPPPNHNDCPPSRSSPALEPAQLKVAPWTCQELQNRAPSRGVPQGPRSTPLLAPDSNTAPAQHHPLAVLLPTPPVIQRPTNRRQSSVRRLRLLEADSLISIT